MKLGMLEARDGMGKGELPAPATLRTWDKSPKQYKSSEATS